MNCHSVFNCVGHGHELTNNRLIKETVLKYVNEAEFKELFTIVALEKVETITSSAISATTSAIKASLDARKAINDLTVQTMDFVNDAINNTAVEGGVLADTFVTVTANGIGTIPRTQRAKNKETISVLDFGADPTGVIDAKSAFIAAVTYATLNKITLEVPYGTYEFYDSTLIDITCNIRGDGKIKGSVRLNGDNLTMSGLEIDGGYNPAVTDSPSNGQLFVAGTNNTVFNCHVHHTNGSGAIYVFGGRDTKILFCNVHDCYGLYGDGICFNRGKNNLAAFNTVKRVQRCGIVGDTDLAGLLEHNLIITGNHLDNTGAPLAFGAEIGAGIWCENVANTTVTNNIIRNFSRRGIVINPETLTNTGEYLDTNFTNIVEGNDIHSIDSLCVGIALAGDSDKGVFRITNNSLRGKYVLGIEIGSNKDVLIENVSFKGTFANKISIYAGGVANAAVTTNVTLSRLIKDVEAYPHVSVAGKCDIDLVGTGYCNLTIDNLRGEWEIKHPAQEFLGAFKANNCTLRFSEVQSPSNPQVYLSSFTEASFIDSTLNIHHTTLRTIGKLNTTNCNIKSYAVGGTNITNPFNSGFITSKGTDFEKVRFKLAHTNNNAVILFQSCNFKDYGDFAIAPDGGLTGDPWQLKVYETTFENSDATKPPFTFNGNPVWGKNQFRNIYYDSTNLFSDTFRSRTLTHSGLVKIGTSVGYVEYVEPVTP